MTASTLGQLMLSYQLVWDRMRRPRAVQLFIAEIEGEQVEGAHFLRTVEQTWSEQGPTLILTPQSAPMLADLLQHAGATGPWVSVQQRLMQEAGLEELARQAHSRGVTLLWRGEPGERPDGAMAPCFSRTIITLSPAEGLLLSHASLRQQSSGAAVSTAQSPVQPEHIVEAPASRLIVDHCLDQRGAWGIAGWPNEDVLMSHRFQPVQVSRHAIVRLIAETDADAALELIEHTLADEPLLAYRFLRYANSAALGLRSDVESLRHGIMLIGLSRLKAWLLEQMPQASNEPDFDPVRMAMVMRARMMEHLLDVGDEDKLRREMFLCGVLSQIDGLLGEPLRDALQRLPLPDRINGAILSGSGPFAPFLALATALEYPRMALVPGLCAEHGLDLADVNRTMLRTLALLPRSAH